jgi:glucan biosynthesis protein C
MERTKDRIYFLDYLRGFMVLLVVLDHSMHAYSQHYGRFWFFPDVERSTFIDVLHLHNDAIMMPFLFFLAGMFVLPSLKRRGYLSFAKERFLRLVVPFVFGIFFITPFMVHHKGIIRDGLQQSFLDFWYDHYIRWENAPFENVSQGGFWFLYYLLVLTVGLVVINAIFPRAITALGGFVRWCVQKPSRGFMVLGFILALILGGSDLMWGAPWWIGFKPVFHVRGSRFIAKLFFFLLGAGFREAGLVQDQAFLNRLSQSWKTWTALALSILGIYIAYTLVFFDTGAYSDAIRYHFFQGGTWDDAWDILFSEAPLVLIRTTLLGLVILSLTIMYMSVFKYFLDKPHAAWQSLAACSFGIYIFHEPFTTATHLWLYGVALDPIIKFIITSAISLSISWLLVAKLFLKLPGFKRIL